MASTTYRNKNSLAAVINDFTQSLESWVINPGEALSSKPSGFVNTAASTMGKLSAYSYNEMQMSKAELNQSTAIRMKSLLRHLPSTALQSIFGTPATITFILSYPEDLLIKQAVAFSPGVSKLTLNRNAKVVIPDRPEFTFDFDIDIFVNRYDSNNEIRHSIYAMYNIATGDGGSIFKVANPFIPSRNDIILEGKRYFTMFIPVKQYDRAYYNWELSGENKDITISYTNNLLGFTVLYKGPSDSSWRQISTYLEGAGNLDGMAYSLTDINTVKNLTLKFNRVPGGFYPVNGTLKLNVYTTLGSGGNFSIPNLDDPGNTLEGLNITIEQDTQDRYQEAIIPLIPTGSLLDFHAVGGKDSLSIEEVRRLVISRSMQTVITPMSLMQACAGKDFSYAPIRHDLLDWEYRLSKFLRDANGNIVPSRSMNVSFLFSELENTTETNSRVIAPYDIFRYNEVDKEYQFVPLKNIDAYTDYLEKYKTGMGNDYLFPYFLRIQNGSRIIIEPYDLAIAETRTTEFSYITQNVLDKMSIMYADLDRNPLDTGKVTIRGSKNIMGNFYAIHFSVFTSAAIIDHLSSLATADAPYVKFKLVVKNKTDGVKYIADVDRDQYVFDKRQNSIDATAYLETNNGILQNGRIGIINNSLTRLPYGSTNYSFYYIDGTCDTELVVLFKDTNEGSNGSPYDNYLTETELHDHYYIGIVYKIDEVTFAKNMKDHLSFNPDVKITQPVYKIADKDIPDVYSETVYKQDDGKYVVEKEDIKLADGSIQRLDNYVVLHKKGDIKKELDGRIGTYNISTQNGIWSNEEANEGIFNAGDILGGNAIYSSVKSNDGLIIFAGKDGRVGCYDVNTNSMYPYNSETVFRDTDHTKRVIKSDGSPIAHADIRSLLIVSMKEAATDRIIQVLVASGDRGLIASCNLASGVWAYCDGTRGDAFATIFNNGSAMGTATIYCSCAYENLQNPERNSLIFAGGDGHLCSYNLYNKIWYNFDSTYIGDGVITNDGRAMGYKAILTMANYLNSILFLGGILGHIATCDLATRQFTHFDASTGIHSAGEVMGTASIYASNIINSIYVAAGEGGRVASYDLAKSNWISYDQAGFASKGEMVGFKNINALEVYDNYMIFGADDGLVASYNIFTNEWTAATAASGIRNDGSFIKNAISTIIKNNTIIYFAGKAGNVIYKYRKGDILIDENNAFVVERPSELQGIIKALPVYDRIYAVKSSYFTILKSYNAMIGEIEELFSQFFQGCKLFLGVKNTSGKSSTYKFINLKTKEEEYLDNLSLSLSIGVHFSDSVFDDNKSFLVEEIKKEIIKYIQEIQTASIDGVIRLNFATMFDILKDRVPNIDYFELYSINDYDAHECQTIFWEKEISLMNVTMATIAEEYLSIKNNVDETKSDISNQVVAFTPAIAVAIL
jgi:hypothetical protein